MTDQDCRHEHLVSGLYDGELNWLRRLLIRRHLRNCAMCREALELVETFTVDMAEAERLDDQESSRIWRGVIASLSAQQMRRPVRLVSWRPVLAPAATIALGLIAIVVVRFAIIDEEPQQTEDCIVEWVRSDYEGAVPFYYQPAGGPTVIWVFEGSGGNGAESANES
jgi:hypothetical protein